MRNFGKIVHFNTDLKKVIFRVSSVSVLFIVLILNCIQFSVEIPFILLGILSIIGIILLSVIELDNSILKDIYTIVGIILIPIFSVFLLQSYTISPIGEKGIYTNMLIVNIIIYFLIFTLCVGITGRFSIGYRVAIFIFFFIGIVNYFIVLFRGSPVMPWDIMSFKTALSVSGRYDYELNQRFFWCSTGFIAMFVYSKKMEGIIKSSIFRVVIIIITVLGFIIGTEYLCKKEVKDKIGMDQTLFTPNVCYRNNGLIATFVGNIDLMIIQKPNGYSKKKVNDIIKSVDKDYQEQKNDIVPKNIIVIMDEAFSDLSVHGDFGTSEDYMPFFKNLKNECGGYLQVSVKGGNTANTEFEFLTGDTLAFLPAGSIPYQQYIKNDKYSVARQLKELGYETVAMHPYRASGWNRDKVYPMLGFDEFIDMTDFENPETLRTYITDDAMFKKIAEILEVREEPQFVFGVTMQNHGGYSKDYEDLFPEIKLTDISEDSIQVQAVEKYLTLIKYSDDAFANFINYLSIFDEPTVVIAFGDHQPSDYITHVIDRITKRDDESEVTSVDQEDFIVPYFVWNNYGAKFDMPNITSTGILSTYFLERIGIPLNAYQRFLLKLSETVKSINVSSIVDKDDEFKFFSDETKEEKDILNDYKILQYNHLFEKEPNKDLFEIEKK